MGLFDSGESWAEQERKKGAQLAKQRIAEQKRQKKEKRRQTKKAEERKALIASQKERSRAEIDSLMSRGNKNDRAGATPLSRGSLGGGANSFLKGANSSKASATPPRLRRF